MATATRMGGATMTGSEKQVAWAMDIRAEVEAGLDRMEAALRDEDFVRIYLGLPAGVVAGVLADIEATRGMIAEVTEARAWINSRGDLGRLLPRSARATTRQIRQLRGSVASGLASYAASKADGLEAAAAAYNATLRGNIW